MSGSTPRGVAPLLRKARTVVIASSVVRTFTLDEANGLLSSITPIFARVSRMWVTLHRIARPLGVDAANIAAPVEGSTLPPEMGESLERARLLAEVIRADEAVLDALGVVLHETHRSVAGFRSVVDGERDVLLCWQLGEREVRFFREVGASFESRQPVEGHRFFRSRQLRAPTE